MPAETVVPARRCVLMQRRDAPAIDEPTSMNPAPSEHEVDATAEGSRCAGDARPILSAVCASRGSALAMVQTRQVAAWLARRGVATTVLTLTTAGDRDVGRPIERLGTVNVFVTELESALRDKRADYAVHSCKDLPSELAGDMRLPAISAREDPRDAFCSERYASFDALPNGAIVATSSPRRRLQLHALRPDLQYEDIRGNVDTRLRKLREGRCDAIVLAMAGLNRLRLRATHTIAFDTETLVPAVGQGALAIETRADSVELAALLRDTVNDTVTEWCVRCERVALRALRAGCSAPIGIYAEARDGVMRATGVHVLPNARVLRADIRRHVATVDDAEALGTELARNLDPTRPPLVIDKLGR